MRLANVNGRAALLSGGCMADIAKLSEGRFGPDPMSIYLDWDAFVDFASTVAAGTDPFVEPFGEIELRNPVPHPRQVFAVGINYRSHAEETSLAVPEVPAVFTKFPASLAGPYDDVEVFGPAIDWEAELVAVIGRTADRVPEQDAWSVVAGLAVGQDISDRHLQFAAGGQFSLGKSRRGYGPIGPWLVTVDELDDPEDLAVGCSVNGVKMQDGRSGDLVFSVPRLIAEISAVVSLLPGDVIFTGTPAGIGAARRPPMYLQPGDVLETWVEGIGRLRNHIVAAK
jgi:2,4-diketo-3-deoxy-L-fuconate hydrolase